MAASPPPVWLLLLQLPYRSPEPFSSDVRGKIKHYLLGRSTLFYESDSTGSERSAEATGFGVGINTVK